MKLREFLNMDRDPKTRIVIRTNITELGVCTIFFAINCCSDAILDKKVISFRLRPYEDVDLMVHIEE